MMVLILIRDLTVTQALDAGDTVTDVFTYIVSDGNVERIQKL